MGNSRFGRTAAIFVQLQEFRAIKILDSSVDYSLKTLEKANGMDFTIHNLLFFSSDTRSRTLTQSPRNNS